MQRREFLKLTVLSAATASLAACGSDSEPFSWQDGTRYFPLGVVSGEPQADSVILWSRVKPDGNATDMAVRLQVAEDESFTRLVLDNPDLLAQAAHDHCLKVKVIDLQAGRFYFYRFIYTEGNTGYSSRTGRTKTAPAKDADVAVRFAVLSCQDYIGRYYNSLKVLLAQTEEPDFIIYAGDYIYETTGDPRFQTTGGARQVTLSQPQEAIKLELDGAVYYAAQSVSNYRDLYKIYRSDTVLQDVHARFPIVAMWDDHEYADDCYGATATYHDGKQQEFNLQRRINAEQAFFEYMPVDNATQPSVFPSRDSLYPNTRLYRDLRFGRHLHLLLSDYRSFRPDHLIPEDAFPGQIIMDKAALLQVFNAQAPGQAALVYEAQKANFDAYVDMNDPAWGQYLPALVLILTSVYQQSGASAEVMAGKAMRDLSGKLSTRVFNQLAQQYNLARQAGQVLGENLPLIDAATEATLDRGLAYLHLGKQDFFSAFGSRYGVVKASFDLYAGYCYMLAALQGETPENVLGSAQQRWLETALSLSDATFVGLGSSVSTTSLVLDLSQQSSLPAAFQTAFYLNLDHWEGFPFRRKYLLEMLKQRSNSFILSGDIHAAFVTDHGGVVDFTGPPVSSETFKTFVAKALLSVGASFSAEQQQGLATQLLPYLEPALQSTTGGAMQFAATDAHGFMMLQVDAQQVTTDYYLLDATRISHDDANPSATRRRFIMAKGAGVLAG